VKVESEDVSSDATQMAARALDVYQITIDTAASHTAQFAPYLVFYWKDIPDALKSGKAYWYERCGGYIAAGYDAASQPALTSLADLLGPGRMVGEPSSTDRTIPVVVAASVALGGSADDASRGIDFFKSIKAAGNLVRPIDHPAPVEIAWNFELPRGYARVPIPATVAGYDVAAINAKAPHPAAARLWQEYLFSDAGQNRCLQNDSIPSRIEAMRTAGVLDVAAAASADPLPTFAVMLTPDQMAKDRAYFSSHWAAAIGP
jgi:putative spermidine/putrescine transport system substrate-binding protein